MLIVTRPVSGNDSEGELQSVSRATISCEGNFLPEIASVAARQRRDIEFVVVGTNAGGDTPARLRACARQQHVTLPLAFDQGKKAHAAFGLSGFPGIVVIDRAGRVCLTRQGYNSSESSFRSDLTQLLESL